MQAQQDLYFWGREDHGGLAAVYSLRQHNTSIQEIDGQRDFEHIGLHRECQTFLRPGQMFVTNLAIAVFGHHRISYYALNLSVGIFLERGEVREPAEVIVLQTQEVSNGPSVTEEVEVSSLSHHASGQEPLQDKMTAP